MAKFSWCMTNDHEHCPKRNGKLLCTCDDCGDRHGSEHVPTPDGRSPLMIEIGKRYLKS